MNKSRAVEFLNKLFVARDNGLEGNCFRSEYMSTGSEAYPIYEAVSNAMSKSGLTHSFSYEIAERAVSVLVDVEDWNDDDAIQEQVDCIVPIYTGELMEIYVNNHWAVDEAVEEMGSNQDSVKNAQLAWFMQIQRMVEAIKSNLKNVIV